MEEDEGSSGSGWASFRGRYQALRVDRGLDSSLVVCVTEFYVRPEAGGSGGSLERESVELRKEKVLGQNGSEP